MGKNTKEVNARHKKILDDLLKKPDNKVCADCNEKGKKKQIITEKRTSLGFNESWSFHLHKLFRCSP
jgi:hypothetical protein